MSTMKMPMFIIDSCLLVLASALSLLIVYYHTQTTTILQMIAFLLLLLLFLLNRYFFKNAAGKQFNWPRYAILFFSSFFFQVLVISTGGFFSSFLILLHLFTLGTSFFVNLSTATIFLGLSIGVLFLHLRIDPYLSKLMTDDPFSIVLYLSSFVVIIPLSIILSRSYHLKDSLSKILSDYIQYREKREQLILRDLSELVVVTDPYLKIVSVNEAVERALRKPNQDIVHKGLLEILPMKDKNGILANEQSLSIQGAIEDHASRIIEGFSIQPPTESQPIEVNIQVRPIAQSKGGSNQLIFVITNSQLMGREQSHNDLDQAKNRNIALASELKQILKQSNLQQYSSQVELFQKIEEDILSTIEIEDHPFKPIAGFPDIAQICKIITGAKQEFAKSLRVAINFQLLPEEAAEAALLRLKENNIGSLQLGHSDFDVPIDTRWLSLILQKLVDVAILMASNQINPTVTVVPMRNHTTGIDVVITASAPPLTEEQLQNLLIKYYGDLANQTNLKLGSGLEGYIAKTIANKLGVPLEVKYQKVPSSLVMTLKLTKEAHQA